ncbi:hypothetical protein [Rhodovulum marinum]|uniref:hypothetical protein n=1 Tax=Rhodovulum marinum TaxID=320662 RepID=UPI001052CF09|nr:hypothetical protein [Rhodovulum marinum]
MKLTKFLSAGRGSQIPALVSGVSILSLMFSDSFNRTKTVETALKSSLIANRSIAIPSQYMEDAFRGKLLEWAPKRRVRSKHLKLQEAFLFIDDEDWHNDQSFVEYHPDVSISLNDFDRICYELGASEDNVQPLGYNHFSEEHEFHDRRNSMEIDQDIDDLYGVKYYSRIAQNSELRKYLLAILAGAKVDLNAFDLYYLSHGSKLSAPPSESKFRLVDPVALLETANEKFDLLLPDISDLDWEDIVELRENPKTEAFRQFVSNDNYLAKEKHEILIEINEALIDGMGLFLPKRKSNFLTKLFENLPIPAPIPLPNPYTLWKWQKESKAVASHYEKYPWFWTYYNCRSGNK